MQAEWEAIVVRCDDGLDCEAEVDMEKANEFGMLVVEYQALVVGSNQE